MGVILIAWTIAGCVNNKVEEAREETGTPVKTIKQALRDHTRDLMSLPGVVGTGQGLCDDKPCIKVFVVKMTPEFKKNIPKNLDGFLVSVEETGEFKALHKNSTN